VIEKDKVVFLLGPTAVGKSYFAIELAKKFDGEIISADSVQVYKDLNIGSAKILKEEMQGVKHHGIDILEADENFSVHDFVEFTKKKIKEIYFRKKLPIVVGGTGLYIKALTLGYNFGGVEENKVLRDELEKIAKEKGNDCLFEMLKEKDEVLAEKTDKFNTVRLIRAIEIALAKGNKKTEEVDIEPLVVALNKERSLLYDNINQRVEKMFEEGLLQEVENLKNRGLENAQSMRAIGYKETVAYLNGECSFEQMKEQIKQHTRNYAKRQMTFLRGMDCKFVDVENKENALTELELMVEKFLKK